MIDISKCPKIASDFEGSERKFAILYNNVVFMVKEPDPIREKDNLLSYMNNQYSEDIGCRIFKSFDIPTQDTFLAKYTRNDGKTEIVVACRDFRKPGEQLYEADKFAKSILDSAHITRPSLNSIYNLINSIQSKMPIDENLKMRFWDTFVIDSLIGNKDRHLGNWGVLSRDRIHLHLAPVYDCGSSLGATVDDKTMQLCLDKPGIMSNVECNIITPFLVNGKRSTYREMLMAPPDDLKASIIKIVPQINLSKIKSIIEDTPSLSDSRKQFLFLSVSMRFNQILLKSYKKLELENIKTMCQTADGISALITQELLSGKSFYIVKRKIQSHLSGSIADKNRIFRDAINIAKKNNTVKKILDKSLSNSR